jgi:DNA-binding transcriptional MocR family regulator
MTNTVNGVLTQAALIEYLRHGGFEHHLRRLRAALASLHQRALELIGSHFPRGTLVEPAAGGYLLWLRLPARVNAVDVYRLALRQGITVAPGPVFSSGRRVRQGLRLNFAQDLSPRRDAALATLGRIVSSLS